MSATVQLKIFITKDFAFKPYILYLYIDLPNNTNHK